MTKTAALSVHCGRTSNAGTRARLGWLKRLTFDRDPGLSPYASLTQDNGRAVRVPMLALDRSTSKPVL